MSLVLDTNSAAETRQAGRLLGAAVAGPLALLLRGDYGTGKTTFVQGLAEGLGVAGPVRSPSYLLAKAYTGAARTLVHADLYRVRHPAEAEDLGLAELAGPEGVIAVEWPGELALPVLRGLPRLTVDFTADAQAGGRRRLVCTGTADLPASLLEALHAAAAR